MKNVVSFETARALKDAGFPQPEPEAGQVWYDIYEYKYMILDDPIGPHGNITSVWVFPDDSQFAVTTSIFLKDHCVFAPTVTDILSELGDNYGIFAGCNSPFTVAKVNTYREVEYLRYSYNTNPAESGAAEYIKIKKTPQP